MSITVDSTETINVEQVRDRFPDLVPASVFDHLVEDVADEDHNGWWFVATRWMNGEDGSMPGDVRRGEVRNVEGWALSGRGPLVWNSGGWYLNGALVDKAPLPDHYYLVWGVVTLAEGRRIDAWVAHHRTDATLVPVAHADGTPMLAAESEEIRSRSGLIYWVEVNPSILRPPGAERPLQVGDRVMVGYPAQTATGGSVYWTTPVEGVVTGFGGTYDGHRNVQVRSETPTGGMGGGMDVQMVGERYLTRTPTADPTATRQEVTLAVGMEVEVVAPPTFLSTDRPSTGLNVGDRGAIYTLPDSDGDLTIRLTSGGSGLRYAKPHQVRPVGTLVEPEAPAAEDVATLLRTAIAAQGARWERLSETLNETAEEEGWCPEFEASVQPLGFPGRDRLRQRHYQASVSLSLRRTMTTSDTSSSLDSQVTSEAFGDADVSVDEIEIEVGGTTSITFAIDGTYADEDEAGEAVSQSMVEEAASDADIVASWISDWSVDSVEEDDD